ncbi:MAG: hypothetical protein Q9Q13_13010 [Acidobacteriota bacterium]|nr:hypothetical protein [Acidobacteriota bacterium]
MKIPTPAPLAPRCLRGLAALAVLYATVAVARSACLPDGLELTALKGPAANEVTLRWTGADPGFELYGSEDPTAVVTPENLLTSTREREWIDSQPTGHVRYYLVRSSSSLQQLGFESQGPDGDFDLDLGVAEGLWRGRAGAFGAYSRVASGPASFTLVRTELGFVDAAAPRCVVAVTDINDITPASDPQFGELRWVHEVPTVTWRRKNGEWNLFYQTYPEDASGERLFDYSWIAHKSMRNRPTPDAEPDIDTLSAKERRLFAGLAYNDRLTAATDPWAHGEPIDPVPANTKYLVYTEPGGHVSRGKLYLALSAMFCPDGGACEGDIVLLRSADGEAWEYLGVLLAADDAKPFGAFFSYFTAPAIYRSPDDDTLRLIVTPANTFDVYQGLYEFEIEDLDAARVLRNAQGRPIPRFELPPESPLVHTGAGSFHHGLRQRIVGKHFPEEPGRFRVFTHEP